MPRKRSSSLPPAFSSHLARRSSQPFSSQSVQPIRIQGDTLTGPQPRQRKLVVRVPSDQVSSPPLASDITLPPYCSVSSPPRVKALKNHLQLVELSRHLPHFFYLLIDVVRLIAYVSICAKSWVRRITHVRHNQPSVWTADVRSHRRCRHYCSLEISYQITSRASTTFVHHYLTSRAETSPHVPFTFPISLLRHLSQHKHQN